MPRQRSKKLSADRKPAEKAVVRSVPEENSSDSDNESDDSMAKDDEEDELERLVLGDRGDFKAQLSNTMDVDDEEHSAKEDGEEEGEDEAGLENVDDADLFFLDAGPSTVDPIPSNASGDEKDAWEDSDDDRLAISLAGDARLRKLRVNETEDIVSGGEYTKRLRRQFERLNPVPEWALPSSRPAKRRRRSSAGSHSSLSSNDMDVDEADLSTLPLARILQNAASLTRSTPSTNKRPKLRPEVLDIQQTRSIPLTQPSGILSLSFHPSYPVLLSSGLASTLYLHHIAPNAHPQPHPLLTSVHVKHTPIHTSSFLSPLGDKIFFSGRRRYFHTWDLPSGTIQKTTRIYGQSESQRSMERFKLSPCGNYMALVGSSKKGGGIINVLDAGTTQWVASMRIEGSQGIADFAWWSDGKGLTVVSKGSEVAEWSLESRSYVARWIDEGYGPTVLTLGGHHGPASFGGDRWVVIGSESGIVNIYDRNTFISSTSPDTLSIPERPKPKRSFDQLTKPASNLEISPDGQILAFSSKWKKDALRLVHLPSCTVYRNWPTDKTPLGRITALAFGRESDIIAVGNEAGKIRLWEIRA